MLRPLNHLAPAVPASLRSPVLLLIVGAALIAGAIVSRSVWMQSHEADLRGIATLRTRLDSTRAALAAATTAADSSRLVPEVAEREFYLNRRAFHTPLRQETLDAWWSLRGPGTLLATLGTFCLALAGILAVRRRHASPASTSTT